MRHTFLPEADSSRDIIRPSSSSSFCRSMDFTASSPSISNSASTDAFSAPVVIRSLLARSPSARFTASIMMDLPAPVSPVSTLSPLSKSISSRSIKATFFIDSLFNINLSAAVRP